MPMLYFDATLPWSTHRRRPQRFPQLLRGRVLLAVSQNAESSRGGAVAGANATFWRCTPLKRHRSIQLMRTLRGRRTPTAWTQRRHAHHHPDARLPAKRGYHGDQKVHKTHHCVACADITYTRLATTSNGLDHSNNDVNTNNKRANVNLALYKTSKVNLYCIW